MSRDRPAHDGTSFSLENGVLSAILDGAARIDENGFEEGK